MSLIIVVGIVLGIKCQVLLNVVVLSIVVLNVKNSYKS